MIESNLLRAERVRKQNTLLKNSHYYNQDDNENSEKDRRVKRSNSLRKLPRNLNAFSFSPDGSPKKSQKKKSLIQLEECGVANFGETREIYLPNVAEEMLQESDDPAQNRSKLLEINKVAISPKADPTMSPKQASSPTRRGRNVSIQQLSQRSTTEKFCRFCFETEESVEKGKLICPCRCDGSLKHIHENCLQTWIVQRGSGRDSQISARCEICSAVYHLEIVRKLALDCKRAYNEGLVYLLISLGLAVCIGNVIWVTVKYLTSSENGENPTLGRVLPIVCPVLAFLFFLPMLVCLKRAFFDSKVVKMKIHNFDPNYENKMRQAEGVSIQIRNNGIVDDIFLDASDEESDPSPRRISQNARRNSPPPRQSRNESLNVSNQQLMVMSVSLQS